jgi:NTP pyrophosphatase (non-canonical NTP hydrolase)
MNIKDLTRCIKYLGVNNPMYWTTALPGEVGELSKRIKKLVRDGDYNKEAIEENLGSILIYTLLTAKYFRVDLEKEFFNKIDLIDSRPQPEGIDLSQHNQTIEDFLSEHTGEPRLSSFMLHKILQGEKNQIELKEDITEFDKGKLDLIRKIGFSFSDS